MGSGETRVRVRGVSIKAVCAARMGLENAARHARPRGIAILEYSTSRVVVVVVVVVAFFLRACRVLSAQ